MFRNVAHGKSSQVVSTFKQVLLGGVFGWALPSAMQGVSLFFEPGVFSPSHIDDVCFHMFSMSHCIFFPLFPYLPAMGSPITKVNRSRKPANPPKCMLLYLQVS